MLEFIEGMHAYVVVGVLNVLAEPFFVFIFSFLSFVVLANLVSCHQHSQRTSESVNSAVVLG
eukprot:m.5332 g.5332  ORF g.5332 m.5332 type:complete len:62 (+) comp4924_c0_seq2:236-421(+)